MDISRHVMLSTAIQMTWKLKLPSPSNAISAESILNEHIIQKCGQRACVCVTMVQKTDFQNIEKSRNDQPLKMEEKLKNYNGNSSFNMFNRYTILWIYLYLEPILKSGFNPVKLSRSL